MISKANHIRKLVDTLKYSFGKYNIRRSPTFHDKELLEYKRSVKTYRKEVIQDYWKRQTEIENYDIGISSLISEQYLEDQREKKNRDDIKFNTSIIRIAYATQKHIVNSKI